MRTVPKESHFAIRVALMVRRIEQRRAIKFSDAEYRQLAYVNALDDALARRATWLRFGGSLQIRTWTKYNEYDEYDEPTGEESYLSESDRLDTASETGEDGEG